MEVEFTFDATGLGGTTVVCFEELWQDDLKMAVHADIEDQDQSIFFPEIGTQVKIPKPAFRWLTQMKR